MFEIIGVIIYGLAIGAWWALKLSAKILYYTLPIFFVFFGFLLGGEIGKGCFGSLENEYRDSVKKEFTHKVTIYWDEMEADYTVISVREDLNWYLTDGNSIDYYTDLYDKSQNIESTDGFLPSEAKKEGFVFKGLYDTAMGNGTQYVTESGYSLMRITEDMELYAYWEAE